MKDGVSSKPRIPTVRAALRCDPPDDPPTNDWRTSGRRSLPVHRPPLSRGARTKLLHVAQGGGAACRSDPPASPPLTSAGRRVRARQKFSCGCGTRPRRVVSGAPRGHRAGRKQGRSERARRGGYSQVERRRAGFGGARRGATSILALTATRTSSSTYTYVTPSKTYIKMVSIETR